MGSEESGEARPRGGLSRRRFSALAIGTGIAAVGSLASLRAAETATVGADVDIETADGAADAFFVHPRSGGPHPGVLIWPDIFGLRPAFRTMATRLAESGFAVLVVNPFYRSQHAPTAPVSPDFSDPVTRQALLKLKDSLTPQTARRDASAFVDYLDRHPAVDRRRALGTAGYCMGGPLVLRTAAARPDRIGAAASFHGGGLSTDDADSPHHLIPRMKGQFLIAIAASDDAKDPASKEILREAFAAARLPAEIEVYAGTRHGWCPIDSAAYDHDQAEKAWSRMLALFGRTIRAPI